MPNDTIEEDVTEEMENPRAKRTGGKSLHDEFATIRKMGDLIDKLEPQSALERVMTFVNQKANDVIREQKRKENVAFEAEIRQAAEKREQQEFNVASPGGAYLGGRIG